MATHTPGPWRVFRMMGSNVLMAGERRVARLYRSAVNPNTDADAHLIAAAPDLLAALKDLLDGDGDTHTRVMAARAAVAKAEGR